MAALPTALERLLDDVVAEHDDLDYLVAALQPSSWDIPTPAPGWAVRDQVSHLAFFDDAARMALTDPAGFEDFAAALLGRGGDPMEEHLRKGRELEAPELLAWWRRARASLVEEARLVPPGARVPWFGPSMGIMSFMSARLMETWAHGQDVADALGRGRVPSERLRHVAELGVRTRAFSYAVRGLDPPQGSVRVELESPAHELWEWGTVESGSEWSTVKGSALDFCLVVTQRRHLEDTTLEVHGEAARQWLEIAQAFAGPPGRGRRPGATGPARTT